MELLPALALVLFSLTVHECAHGWMAEKCGDDTARMAGRITLNPLPHVDPIGTFFFPLVLYFLGLPLFGWAKPTPVNPSRMNNPHRGMLQVALAGPLSNFCVALGAAGFWHGVISLGTASEWSLLLLKFCSFAVLLNVVLALFNLLPIPPLDGAQVLLGCLPTPAAERFQTFAPYGQWVLVFLLLTHQLQKILWPLVNGTVNLLGVNL